MSLFRFGGGGGGGGFDDMFGNVDNMMNQLMGNMMIPSPFGAMSPFANGPFMSPFNQIQSMMQQHQRNFAMPNNGSSFVSSSFVSFSSDGNNPPMIYQETKMNQVGPNGVREERHTVQDSRTGLQKMKIGRHIQDRGHVIERSKNRYTGDEEENNEFINIEEEEADDFQQEWSSQMDSYRRTNNQQHLMQGPRSQPRLAITAGPIPRVESPSMQGCSTSTSYNNSSNETKKYSNKSIMKNKKSSSSKKAPKKE